MNNKKETAYFYYDGECPFCKSYSKFISIRQKINLQLIDARLHPNKIKQLQNKGYDINKGMILQYKSKTYTGPHALTKLNNLITLKNRYLHSLFSKVANNHISIKLIYPWIKILRKALLWILKIDKINK